MVGAEGKGRRRSDEGGSEEDLREDEFEGRI